MTCLVEPAEAREHRCAGAALRCLDLRSDVQAALHGPGRATAHDRALGEACMRGGDGQRAPHGGELVRRGYRRRGEHTKTARLKRNILDINTRLYRPEHLAISLLGLGECAKAAVFPRTTFAARTRTVGPYDEDTFTTEIHLVRMLNWVGEYTEAEALGRSLHTREASTHSRLRPLRHSHRVRQFGGLALMARQECPCRGD